MITSLANGKIKRLVQLREKSRARNEEEVFVAEGIKMFMEAPLSVLREIYVSEGLRRQGRGNLEGLEEKLARCRGMGIEVDEVSEEVFRKASDTHTPQGILFVAAQFSYALPELLGKALGRQQAGGRPPLFLLLEDVQDPGNFGTMLRTGEGAGVDGVVMTVGTVDVYNPKTIRATMGSLYRVPFLYTDGLAETVALLKEKGIAVYAAHLKGERYYDEILYEGGCAFLVGNEGNGLQEETAGLADTYIKIPMEGKLESLNAAVAAALLLYQAAGSYRRGGYGTVKQ